MSLHDSLRPFLVLMSTCSVAPPCLQDSVQTLQLRTLIFHGQVVAHFITLEPFCQEAKKLFCLPCLSLWSRFGFLFPVSTCCPTSSGVSSRLSPPQSTLMAKARTAFSQTSPGTPLTYFTLPPPVLRGSFFPPFKGEAHEGKSICRKECREDGWSYTAEQPIPPPPFSHSPCCTTPGLWGRSNLIASCEGDGVEPRIDLTNSAQGPIENSSKLHCILPACTSSNWPHSSLQRRLATLPLPRRATVHSSNS